MTISELAKACGVKIDTVRYYERRGLLKDPRRGGVGYRVYSKDDVRRICFIKDAQGLGFTLKEITQLLELRVSKQTSCADVEGMAREKISDIDQKVRTLKVFKRALERLVSQCARTGPTGGCPILDALDASTTVTKQRGRKG